MALLNFLAAAVVSVYIYCKELKGVLLLKRKHYYILVITLDDEIIAIIIIGATSV